MPLPVRALEEVSRLVGTGHMRHLMLPAVTEVVFILQWGIAVGWIIEDLMQFEPIGYFLWGVFMAAITHMHAIDVNPSIGVHDTQERSSPKVHLFHVSTACGSPFHDVVHDAHLRVLFFFLPLGFHILDAEVVGVRRSIAESDLQRLV